jgi:hypothetical protein
LSSHFSLEPHHLTCMLPRGLAFRSSKDGTPDYIPKFHYDLYHMTDFTCSTRPWSSLLQDIVEHLSSARELRTFWRYLESTGMAAKLREMGPVTLFAPSDEAFAKMAKVTLPPPPSYGHPGRELIGRSRHHLQHELEHLQRDASLMRQILSHHVLPTAVPAANVAKVRPL